MNVAARLFWPKKLQQGKFPTTAMKRSLSPDPDHSMMLLDMLVKRTKIEPDTKTAEPWQYTCYWIHMENDLWEEVLFEYDVRLQLWWSWEPRLFWSEDLGWGEW